MPRLFKPRPVQFALKEKIAEELRRLEKIGVLGEGGIFRLGHAYRICGDYKVMINPVLDVPEHLMPTADDLFTQLNGGEKFTKLDFGVAASASR